jgi:hypothetical protein
LELLLRVVSLMTEPLLHDPFLKES